MPSAIIVGASSGIGLALAQRLVAAGWDVVGLARRDAALTHERYRHMIADVRAADYRDVLVAALPEALELCVYAAGIGFELDATTMEHEVDVFATNLGGCVATAAIVIPRFVAARRGQLIGLSSQADRKYDQGAPSYTASKAGMSSYLEGLARNVKQHGVAVTNVRFGFVDTAMAKSPVRPFMITAERAAEVVERCIATRPIRKTYPLRMAALLWFVRWFM